MLNRRGVVTFTAVALVAATSLSAQRKDDKKQDETLRKEVQGAVKIADDAMTVPPVGQAGPPPPADFALAWIHEDIMKATNKQEYVPFIVSLDPSKVSGGKMVFYWRAVSKTGPNPLADSKKDGKRPMYPYEDVSVVEVKGKEPIRVARSFTVPAGSYDIYVVMREFTPTQKNAPPPKAALLKQSVTVPDYWNGDLATSSVIITERIDPLPAPLTPQQQVDRPYALGNMELVPAVSLKFSKKAELATFILIYNPKTDSSNKPDVTVEYNFYEKSAGAEKFFNKTSPQNLNAQTLPPTFDMVAGGQLQSGQAVPLASFPEGEYRLEIKIIDKLGNKTITRDVNFSVGAS